MHVRNVFISDSTKINEQAFIDAAYRHNKRDGEKTRIHKHSSGMSCNSECYNIPEEK